MTSRLDVCINKKIKLINMKSAGRIMMMILVLSMAVSSIMHVQRGMRGMMTDSVIMGRPGDRMIQMRHMNMPPDSMRMNMMRNHMERMRIHGAMWGVPMYHPNSGFGMRSGMARKPGFRFSDGFGSGSVNHPEFGPLIPGLRRLETVPNLTEKQKKDIADLRQIHQDEMQKFREETAVSMKSMRDAHRKKLMDILTDEQKKYLEGNSPTSPPIKK